MACLPRGPSVVVCGGAAAQELGGSLSLAMPYLTDNPDTAFVVRERVRNGELMQLKALIKEGVDFKTCFLAPAPTVRGYTPLHIAAWGTAKPNYDRDIVEVILQAAKKAGSEAESAVRAAKDLVDGETPLDLVRVFVALRPNGCAPWVMLLPHVRRPSNG